ncbi:MAG: amino acid permease [Gemmatimonadetes bacterium]|nr:amino acid permease [Gemmatimonadota bacterium]MBI2403003.1 amino acid permease [Gemmatimonadota bacterium]MBI2537803.1 amino acid permease [Gemmatimonadota bacterium]
MSQLLARKSVSELLVSSEAGLGLKRALGKWQLTALGVGAIIGAGIFASTGTAIVGDQVRLGAGPAIVLSFLMTAVACGFAALCYAEFAAMVPISGSAYTYAYASLGEMVAWIIGWDLIIEYAVGNIAVAISWAGHFRELMSHFGVYIPAWLSIDYRTAHQAAAAMAQGATDPGTQYLASAVSDAPHLFGLPVIINVPAVAIVVALTALLVYGIRESAVSNSIMVLLKVGILLFFIAVGAFLIRPQHYTAHGGFAPNGFAGISAAAAIIFFSYIGFDAVSTAAEEAKDPRRDMPFGIVMSLVICTGIFVLVALVMTGMAPWRQLGTAEPMITALALAEGNERLVNLSRFIVALGAVFAMTTVLLVFQLGQPRIFFSMARDGLLPPWAAKVHPRFRTPHVTTIITGVFVAVFAAFANIDEVVELTNIGTLFAFMLVAAGVIILRRTDPGRERPFRTPWVPWVPLLSIASCLFLMIQLPRITWIRFGLWLALGLLLYFSYGFWHSRMRMARAPGGQR